MTARRSFAAIAAVFVMALGFLVSPLVASAHEHREVGDYTIVVGFLNEPAVQGDTNGLWFSVEKAKTPVTGLTDTLKAQVIFGDQTRDLTLKPAFGEDGAYESIFIPTEPGDYTFRIYGTIEGMNVDETFTSSPEGFDSVQARKDLEFPASEESGSRDDSTSTLAMPFAVGAGALLIAGGARLMRRRAA